MSRRKVSEVRTWLRMRGLDLSSEQVRKLCELKEGIDLLLDSGEVPEIITLTEWRRGRRDGYSDKGNANRLVNGVAKETRAGRRVTLYLPGAEKRGRDWFVPRGAEPTELAN